LVFDPQWVVRNGLRQLILDQTAFSTIVEAVDEAQARSALAKTKNLELIIMELMAAPVDRFQAFESVLQAAPSVPVIVMSDRCSREEILETINMGATGFISKGAERDEILLAIKAANEGEIYISKALLDSAGAREDQNELKNGNAHGAAIAKLTQRQREVLEELAQGHSNRVIAENLGVSEHTVKIHVAAILKSLNVDNRTQAALMGQSKKRKSQR
jgi:two-component system, NarL family, nitrate/nitrite response regulator NarL